MALFMVLPSSGFAIDMHYCQDQLKSIGVFSKVESCHSSIDKKNHKIEKQATCHTVKIIESSADNCKKDCCSNQVIQFEKETVDNKITAKINVDLPINLSSVLVYTKPSNQEYFNNTFVSFTTKNPPPLLNEDIPILIQSFLL